ncbi:MAG: AbrB/MazE/SpoVT family DNA-binding domain-containing protein [Pyrinomonadaceae bacterium]
MKAQIIQIGNSQGIRIPKTLLEETKISGEIELEACPEGILIRNIKKPRGDWDAKFEKLSDVDDDQHLESSKGSNFEKKEWQW